MSVFGSPDDQTPQDKARAGARRSVENLIERLAVEGYDATVVHEPIEGYQIITRDYLEPATAGLSAALQVQRVAGALVYDHVMAARGAGRSWDEIAAAFELPATSDDPGLDIYRHVVMGDELPDDTPEYIRRESKARWTCRSCQGRITDRGPWGGHPDDNEDGHAPDCQRHNAAGAAYMASWEDQ